MKLKKTFKKRPKNQNLPKRVGPCFSSKTRTFSKVFFFFKSSNKRSFSDIPDRKEWLLHLKRRLLKKYQKIKIFPKLFWVHSFFQKIKLFLKCMFGHIQPEKIVFWYSKKKWLVFRPEKTTFIKIQNIELLQRG